MKALSYSVLSGVLILAQGSAAQQYDVRVFGVEDGLTGSTVNAIDQDSTGYLWIDTDGGLCRFDGKAFRVWTATDGRPVGLSSAWLDTVAHRYRLRLQPLRIPPIPYANSEYRVTGYWYDKQADLHWIGTTTGITVSKEPFKVPVLLELTHENGIGGNDIQCLFQDRSGVMWIGARYGGLTRYTSNALTWFDDRAGLPSSQVTRIERTEKGCSIRTLTGSVEVDNNGVIISSRVFPPPGPPIITGLGLGNYTPRLNCVVRTPSAHLWEGWSFGLIDYSVEGSVHVGRDTIEVTALAVAEDSMLIGTEQGLYSAPLDNSAGNWTRLFGAGDDAIVSLARDRAKNIWIGTNDRGLVRFNHTGTRRWTTREGLSSDRVRQVLLDAYDNVWVGTDRGFDHIELDELQEDVLNITHYGTEDGFPGIDAMPNACMLDTDSALWFGTTRGAIRFDPRRILEDPIAPRTRITDLALFFEHPDMRAWCDSFTTDGLPIDPALPYDRNHLTFTFSGLSLAYPEKVRFQYMLEGQDGDWSPITPQDRVTYSGLEPGAYTFLVKARNGSGVWNDEPARFSFTITPPFWRTTTFRISAGLALVLGLFGALRWRDRRSRRTRERLERMVSERTQELEEEKHRSETLLLNILPESTAAELKESGTAQARHYDECTVLFSDFQGFTVLSEQTEATGIVTELDRFFRAFDRITDKYRIEKIKTIGDAYMCVSGVPDPKAAHALDAVLMGLEMLQAVDEINALRIAEGHPAWPIRIGLHSGPLIAGVVGQKKFAYDVWGDTVNLASRMESNGAAGRLNVTTVTLRQVERFVHVESRGHVNVKGKGNIESWFIDRLRPEYSADAGGRKPNTQLLELRDAFAPIHG